MKPKLNLFLAGMIFSCSGCIESAHFLSPTNAASNPYHAVPLKSDSIKGATYFSSLVSLGGANDAWRDNVYAFQARIHRSNNFGNLQAYYGANLSIGAYHIAEYYNYDHNYYDTSNYHTYATNKFFGWYGFNGGLNLVVPTRHGGEWRAIGIETSVQKEFGSYYHFRKNLPDSAADAIFKKNITGTAGIYTDIIGKSRHGAQFGYKMGIGFMLNPENNYAHVYNQNTINPVTYFSNTFHFTKENITGFVQINLSNSYAGNIQFGINYRLGKK
ncbi:MAG TPA: hypothetical protein VMT76_13340 [Puia sp.]|nr:hypothetical protein [Puia sp.]